MTFKLPKYYHPDFEKLGLMNAPDATLAPAEMDGVVPEGFHATSIYPEYYKINGKWTLAEETRMDACVVLRSGKLEVVEPRYVKKGEMVVLGRTEQGEEGVFLYGDGFVSDEPEEIKEAFAFRQGRSRETSYARDYDKLIALLKHEKEHGNILWVMGPAFSFDQDARKAMSLLIENGYADGILAGNALATHDLEGALLHTALGQDIYTQRLALNGHYNPGYSQ